MICIEILLLTAVAYGARYEKATTRIPGRYLIKAKDHVFLDHLVEKFNFLFSEDQGQGHIHHKWDNLNTISVSLPDVLAEKLLDLDIIEYVEENGVLYTQAVGSWGIDRVDQRNLPLDDKYTPTGPTTECYTDPLGADYRGVVAVTSSSKRCQYWTSQSPHKHTRTPSTYPDKGLGDHNYCRNPDNEPGGAWCYTTDQATRWQYCDVGKARASCVGAGLLTGTGRGQTVYVIDTGIRHSHNDYGGRASNHFDYENGKGGEDCHGHGTHCAGTVGGATYGVAPGVTLKSVRVLSCTGSGSTESVINGLNSVPTGGVASMSLGGGQSTSTDNAVAKAVSRGVVVSVAAGNDNANACNYSPARAPLAITVGATTSSDARSSFSNYGSCVDIFAPGSSIKSTWATSNTATNTISGTSMACPHVSGAAALLLARGVPAANVPATLVADGTTNVVKNPGSGSSNVLLYIP